MSPSSFLARLVGRASPSCALLVVFAIGCSEPPLPEAGEWSPSDHTQPERGAATTNQRRAPTTERTTDPLAAAAALWNVTCASCHGRTGGGDGPAAPGPMVSFASAEWQNARSDAEIAQVIVDGRNMMPAFGETIAPAGIEALVGLIRRFGGASPTAPAAPNAGAPNEGAPNAGAPNAVAANAGAPDVGAGNEGPTATPVGAPNAGAPSAGAPNAGAPSAGAANEGGMQPGGASD